jgi:23S rRNA pseudouridine955/2504/2580 synthase
LASEGRDALLEFDPAWVLFQGNGVLVIDKPAGIPVHAGTGHEVGLAEMIDEWVRRNPGVLEMRAGKSVHPVHRLDREASGLLLFGLTKTAARALQTALASHTLVKRYLAVVAGPVGALGELRAKSAPNCAASTAACPPR